MHVCTNDLYLETYRAGQPQYRAGWKRFDRKQAPRYIDVGDLSRLNE